MACPEWLLNGRTGNIEIDMRFTSIDLEKLVPALFHINLPGRQSQDGVTSSNRADAAADVLDRSLSKSRE